MGSNSDFRVTFEPAMTDTQHAVVAERLSALSNYSAAHWEDNGIYELGLDDARWSSVREDLVELSGEFPGLKITCWQRYHDDDTQYMIYVHRGGIEVVEGEVTFRERTLW